MLLSWCFLTVKFTLIFVLFSPVTQSCPTLCDPMNRSTPGLPIHHKLPEFTPDSHPLSQWCHPTISSSCRPLLLLPPIPPRIRLGRCCLLPFKWMTRRINKNLEVKILIKQFRLPTGMNSVPWLQALFTPNCSRKGREGNGTPLQYSCLENPMDGGAWWAAVHGVSKSRTRLSNFTFTFHFHALEKEMATHSSVLAWRIPGTGEPTGLASMGSHRVGHDWSDLAAAAVERQANWKGQYRLTLKLL